MYVYLLFAEIGFVFWIVRNTLFWVMLWQLKEYRWDRLRTHLKETYQGQRLLFSPLNFLKLFLFFAYGFVVFFDSLGFIYSFLVGFVFLIEGTIVIREVLKRGVRRPARTAKALAILGLSLVALFLLFLVPLTNMFLWLLVLDRVLPFLVGLFVVFFAFPTEIYHDYLAQKALKKIRLLPELVVIAVSGSYGKSSTKECIAQILDQKFRVVKTYGSNNTEAGIVSTILRKIQQDTQVFVVEMGAYKKGEVAELCEIAKPLISVTTSISDQHLSLFGGMRQVGDTEMELIKDLPKNGKSLFNGNNKGTRRMYEHMKEKMNGSTPFLYYVDYGKKSKATFGDNVASDVKAFSDGISFSVTIDGKKIPMRTSLLGKHMVENILPAIYLAASMGMSPALIKRGVALLVAPPKTMKRIVLPSGLIVIDDSFNASPESVLAALEYMKTYAHRRVLVLMPLIELGKHGHARHYEIGLAASRICDYLFLTNRNFYDDVSLGVREGKGGCMVLVGSPALVSEEVGVLTSPGDVVVFEGKEAGIVLRIVQKGKGSELYRRK